jgi:hypothetical protein
MSNVFETHSLCSFIWFLWPKLFLWHIFFFFLLSLLPSITNFNLKDAYYFMIQVVWNVILCHWEQLTQQCCITSKKTWIFSNINVRTSNFVHANYFTWTNQTHVSSTNVDIRHTHTQNINQTKKAKVVLSKNTVLYFCGLENICGGL